MWARTSASRKDSDSYKRRKKGRAWLFWKKMQRVASCFDFWGTEDKTERNGKLQDARCKLCELTAAAAIIRNRQPQRAAGHKCGSVPSWSASGLRHHPVGDFGDTSGDPTRKLKVRVHQS